MNNSAELTSAAPLALADAATRTRALLADQSFIVQAPAGSGKTELLTNRLLVLLATVQQPEQIIAITFTRKAAAEMRARVLEKLAHSAEILAGHKPAPASAHEQLTHRLACAVLLRDEALNWQLRALSSRLRILTIDALCSALTRQMPYLSRLGGQANIVDRAETLYETAAQRCLAMLEDESAQEHRPALVELLRHCDNNGELAQRLLVQMLARREQWLPLLGVEPGPDNAQVFAEQIALVVMTELRALSVHIPTDVQIHLMPLAQHAAEQLLGTDGKANAQVQALHDWAELLDEHSELALWRGLRQLLLTADGDLRKAGGVNKNLGFGTEHKAEKAAFVALLNSLQGQDWPLTLTRVDTLPRAEQASQQWPFIAAMLQVLRLCAAHLHALFAERGELDFSEVSQAALQALGSEEEPTDLLLALDYQIQHVLVDEFQDTSISQWNLLRRLTGGWQHGDGRSLFLVGDPMQSIYRFRKAEVSLFLRAQQHGLHRELPLQCLTLQTNFRSQAGIVDWVNQCFARTFPAQADASYGAVAYAPALAIKPATALPAVHCQLLLRADQQTDASTREAELVLAAVRAALTRDDESIAILVRARSHLPAIIAQLQTAAIAYEAVDIQTLAHSVLIADVQQLARALWHPADRLAWLCVLRAPWCGLSAADLFVLCGQQTTLTVYEQLQRAQASGRAELLSADGRARFNHIWPILQEFFLQHDANTLAARTEACWRALGGEAILQTPSERADLEQYFRRLHELRSEDGDIPALLEQLSADLFQQTAAGARVKLMTMHKAKGLEFDTVILPGLGRRPPVEGAALLAWDEYLHDDGELLLVAPAEHKAEIKAGQNSGLTAFLRAREQRRSDEESKRLLYVAATRAKKYLFLFGHAQHSEQGPPQLAARSHLALLWPALSESFMANSETISTTASAETLIEIPLQRLALERLPAARALTTTGRTVNDFGNTQETPTAITQNSTIAAHSARAIGLVVHAWLEHLSKVELPQPAAVADFVERHRASIFSQLRGHGLSRTQAQAAQELVLKALSNTLNDEQGRFLLSQREQAQAEWPLQSMVDGRTVLHIIDRTFVDANALRWIVDYKIVQHSETTLSAEALSNFAQTQAELYREQLNQYAELLHALDGRAQKRALYFPLQQYLHVLS